LQLRQMIPYLKSRISFELCNQGYRPAYSSGDLLHHNHHSCAQSIRFSWPKRYHSLTPSHKFTSYVTHPSINLIFIRCTACMSWNNVTL